MNNLQKALLLGGGIATPAILTARRLIRANAAKINPTLRRGVRVMDKLATIAQKSLPNEVLDTVPLAKQLEAPRKAISRLSFPTSKQLTGQDLGAEPSVSSSDALKGLKKAKLKRSLRLEAPPTRREMRRVRTGGNHPCDQPSGVCSDGSRCGGRAASIRPGGRLG